MLSVLFITVSPVPGPGDYCWMNDERMNKWILSKEGAGKGSEGLKQRADDCVWTAVWMARWVWSLVQLGQSSPSSHLLELRATLGVWGDWGGLLLSPSLIACIAWHSSVNTFPFPCLVWISASELGFQRIEIWACHLHFDKGKPSCLQVMSLPPPPAEVPATSLNFVQRTEENACLVFLL